MKIKSVVISAGLSSRMGKLKPLLKFNGLPFSVNILSKLSIVTNEIIFVLGYEADKIKNETEQYFDKIDFEHLKEKVNFVLNSDYEKGMFTSLQKGLNEIGNTDWVLYHFIDQPGIPVDFYVDFIHQINNDYNWIQPSYKNKKTHPVLFDRSVMNLIINASPDSNLKEISGSEKIKKKIWDCKYSEILMDIDTPEDYKFLTAKEKWL